MSRPNLEAYPSSYTVGTGSLFLGVGRPEREFDYSPPSVAQVRNKWNSTSAYPVSFRDVDRNSYIPWVSAVFIVLGVRQV
jgi:hypothetical protein